MAQKIIKSCGVMSSHHDTFPDTAFPVQGGQAMLAKDGAGLYRILGVKDDVRVWIGISNGTNWRCGWQTRQAAMRNLNRIKASAEAVQQTSAQ